MAEYSRRVTDHGFLPSQSPIKDDLQQLYARNTSQTEEIIETLRGVNDTQLMILSELQTLENLSTKSDAAQEVIALTKEHLEKMAVILYTANGYDEKGKKIPEGVLRFERWTNLLSHAFWNFIIVGVISTLFYFYVEAQKNMQHDKAKAETEILKLLEDKLSRRDAIIEELMHKKDPKKETTK